MAGNRALTTVELGEMKCSDPDCKTPHDNDQLFFHGACHPGAPQEVEYDKRTEALTLRCGVCGKFVASIAVAKWVGEEVRA